MSASINSLFVYVRTDGRDIRVAQCVGKGHIQRSTSGPAGSRTWGLVASAQWLYPDDPGRGGRQTDREKIFTVDS